MEFLVSVAIWAGKVVLALLGLMILMGIIIGISKLLKKLFLALLKFEHFQGILLLAAFTGLVTGFTYLLVFLFVR